MHPNRNETATSTPPEVSQTRRSLLKAAASTAPLIATLPSGAAMAQASAANCVIHEQEVAGNNGPQGFVLRSADDEYLRVDGVSATFFIPGLGVQTVYTFNAAGSQVRVLANGNRVNVTGTGGSPRDVRLLTLYKPVGNPPMGVTNICNIPTGLTGWTTYPTAPDFCTWPIARVEPLQPGNLGMTVSCLASLNP